MTLRLRLLCSLLLITSPLLVVRSQSLTVMPTDSLIRMDGELTESVWQQANVASDFIQNYPNDTLPAYNRTDVRMTYDRGNLYIAVICFDKDRAKPFIASSLKRDFDWDQNDNFTVYLDPFGDRINGFTFNVTPLGVEREGQLYNGERVASEWDNKWRSAVKVYPDRWQAELMIPLKTIRYRRDTRYFLMNFARHDLKNNQRTAWRRVPVAMRISAMAFADTVHFSTPLPNPGPNVSLIPYVSGRYVDGRNEGGASAFKGGIGFDAKIGITPSLNLDLTVNPDFSQVEADQQVTNLSRFELFYPERRQFFIENQDLFANFGSDRTRPFFSRRIGIARDTSTGVIVQNPLLYGARLSGKVGRDWRVGLLNTQTASQASEGINGQNYTVAVVQRQVLGRSNIGAILVNRQRVGGPADSSQFTRVGGLEYNLQTTSNRWSGKVFYQQAIKPYALADARSHGANLLYTSRNFSLEGAYEYIGKNYFINDIGFVPRTGYWRYRIENNTTFYVKGERAVVSHGSYFGGMLIRNIGGQVTDRSADYGYGLAFRNTAEGYAGYSTGYTYLFFAYDPTNSDGLALPQNTAYRTGGAFAHFATDRRKRLNGSIDVYSGGYFNGENTNLSATAQYRFQPYGTLSIAAEYNNIRLPEPYKSAEYLLLGPRADITFSRKVFLTTFMQFNNQTANVNLNARLQWRYASVSDLFVVYQENYLPGSFASKNRALVLKLSYWLNA
ncbi:DUF5916 domain-containing protein [Spirosoma luteum]|uniref:DUF5916 domain-containing protein n=1 Tax=Spirosoma luteum TaxID=431553 RepID=UPI00059172E6|nr:DUF5916 domain-containing protein [Spirosoma luteum]